MQSENVINTLNKSLTSESDNQVFDDFAARIQTYIDGQKWIKKPISLSPPVCSQYGWKCIKTDLLECVTCNAKLSACDSKIRNYESYKACLENTLRGLKENHGKHCPWPLTPCPENFIKMILMPKEEAIAQFLKRVESSRSFQSFFPKINDSVVTNMGFGEHQIMALCKMAGIKGEDALQFGKSIVPLSASGWIITKEGEFEKPILKCNNCLRSVWCGLFSLLNSENPHNAKDESNGANNTSVSNGASESSEDTRDSAQNSEESPTKKRRKISFAVKKGDPFDPLHEHRPWCLWIHNGVNGYTSPNSDEHHKVSRSESNVPGWKIFVKSLLRNISNSQNVEVSSSPSREQIRNVKSLLEKWTDAV